MKEPKRLLLLLLKIVIVTALLGWFLYRENNTLKLHIDEVHFQELPDALDGFRIIHLSDLHSKWFGSNQQKLAALIEKQRPHAIVITGDAVDARLKDEEPVLALIRRISPIAPLLYVNGNHETELPDLEGFLERVEKADAQVLENDSVTVPFGGGEVVFVGLADLGQRSISLELLGIVSQKAFAEVMPESFVVLLAHRPEAFPHYALLPVNLILSGHAHGGQIRLPLIGGLYAPGQGFLPRFDGGLYYGDVQGGEIRGSGENGPVDSTNATSGTGAINGTNTARETGPVMIVSHGLGNSLFPQRLFNRPDVRLVILKKE